MKIELELDRRGHLDALQQEAKKKQKHEPYKKVLHFISSRLDSIRVLLES
jgi:hypothetical protein